MRTVVSGGFRYAARAASWKPTSDTSCGMRSPAAETAAIAPMAPSRLLATIADGRGVAVSSRHGGRVAALLVVRRLDDQLGWHGGSDASAMARRYPRRRRRPVSALCGPADVRDPRVPERRSGAASRARCRPRRRPSRRARPSARGDSRAPWARRRRRPRSRPSPRPSPRRRAGRPRAPPSRAPGRRRTRQRPSRRTRPGRRAR